MKRSRRRRPREAQKSSFHNLLFDHTNYALCKDLKIYNRNMLTHSRRGCLIFNPMRYTGIIMLHVSWNLSPIHYYLSLQEAHVLWRNERTANGQCPFGSKSTENGEYNLISVRFYKIWKRFLYVHRQRTTQTKHVQTKRAILVN